ncbi:MAG: hypothetical protein ABR521_07400 [Gaiellaceae bacterium]
MHRKKLQRLAVASAVAACACVWPLAAAPSSAGKEPRPAGPDVVSAGNPFFVVHVEEAPGDVGIYTVTTGPSHPIPGANVLFGDGSPLTTFNSVRSFTTNTDYAQLSGRSSANTVVDLAPFGTLSTIGSTGVRTVYDLPGPPTTPDALTIVSDVNVTGATMASSAVVVTTTVQNKAGRPTVSIGRRYLWDYQIAEDDGPTFQAQNPLGAVLTSEAAFQPPTFGTYRIEDNDTNPTSPTFAVFGSATGPLAVSPTTPTRLQFVSWEAANDSAFDYVQTGQCVSDPACATSSVGGDSAVMYHFGHDAASATTLQGGQSSTVRAAIFYDAQGPTAVRLASFTASRGARGAVLRWLTVAESDLLGFNVYRQVGARRVKVNRLIIPAVFGGSAGHSYRWVDRQAPRTGTARYWLESVALSGARSMKGPIAAR